MLPFLSVFGKQIPMYGLLIMAGCALGVAFAVYARRNAGIQKQDILFAACYAGVGAFLGAKLLYLALTLPKLLIKSVPLTSALLYELFAYGFVFYGGALGGLGAVFLYARKYKLAYLPLVETLIPSVPLIHAFGRLGCFCAGCCYGIVAQPPWGIYFRADSVALHGVPLLPIQLYEAAFNLLLFVFFSIYAKKPRPAGHILGLYLIAYAIARFVLEFFRYDAARGFLWGVSNSQWIGLLLIPCGVYLLLRKTPERRLMNKARPGESHE
jgi:phosphatidylglycerol:prolipoprotein diacylglycerol transferase